MKRGEIYFATIEPRSGFEQRGRRPVIIVSRDVFNRRTTWRSVNVVPMSTSANQAARGPTAVLITKGTGGLDRDGVAVCHQITTIDRSKLAGRIGELAGDELERVEAGIKAALDLV